ncbi:MAG: HlyU family transcriptional regulator [Rhodobacteraceae bacterium]|nr:HlyU family transcriptional regulator [Paracoccaceae bacterium]
MPFWSRLFGSSTPSDTAPAKGEEYKGFRITPTPIREGSHYRVAARIEKDGRTHELIRADTMASLEDATAISAAKARQMIDEQGERLFGPG